MTTRTIHRNPAHPAACVCSSCEAADNDRPFEPAPLPPRGVPIFADGAICSGCGRERPAATLDDDDRCCACRHVPERCRKCGALNTETNPVEGESETCSACAWERGCEFVPLKRADGPAREY